MLTITAIGSCRVAAPLRLCRESHGFRINTKRVYGYVHSSAEALQMARFLQGQAALQHWPLLAPRYAENPAEVTDQDHVQSDLYVVEIASAKIVRLGDQVVQLNYLHRRYRDFFAETERTHSFTRLASQGGGAPLQAWLAEIWSATPDQQDDSAVLGQIRIDMTTPDSLRADMAALLEMLPEVLFVTHVNARDAQANPLPARVEMIEMTKRAAAELGARVWDPSPLMDQVGQRAAIEDHSTSLAHYTDEFSEQVLEAWYEDFIHDLIEHKVMEAPETEIKRLIVPHVRAFLDSADPARRFEAAALVDTLDAFLPADGHIKRFKLEIALQSGARAAADLVARLAREFDLRRIPRLEPLLRAHPSLWPGLDDARRQTGISDRNAQWLARFMASTETPV